MMWKADFKGFRPRPAERPRFNPTLGRMFIPKSYEDYQEMLIGLFNQYTETENFAEIFDKKKIVYGLSVQVVFRLTGRGKSAFYRYRPDSDNLYKAVLDSLFFCDANTIETDTGELDKDGNPVIKYHQKIDDSNVVHQSTLKLRVENEDEQGFSIIVKNIGKDELTL